MPPASLSETYFSLFQEQLDACAISDPKKHAEVRRTLNQKIKHCIQDLKKEVETNDPEIWFALGHAATFYAKDSSAATQWYQRAAEAGHTKAITKMGNRLKQSKSSDDQEKSHQWLITAANNGDHYAMLSLGISYRDGQGVPKDYLKAQQWFEQARDAGEPTANENLADLHLKHLHSPAAALPHYLQAYANGVKCDEELANIYNTRNSGVYEPIKAKEHYEILVRRGKKSAPWVMLELAKLHASGQVSENGLTHAKKWIYQIIAQCPKSMSIRKKAERLLDKLEETLF